MISVIELSNNLEFSFNNQKELFLYDMSKALENYNIQPKDFRKMSSSDWRAIKAIKQVTSDRLNAYNESKRLEAEARAEMLRRRR